jgi:hypothetical protein
MDTNTAVDTTTDAMSPEKELLREFGETFSEDITWTLSKTENWGWLLWWVDPVDGARVARIFGKQILEEEADDDGNPKWETRRVSLRTHYEEGLREALAQVTRACDGPLAPERKYTTSPGHELWRAATAAKRHEQRTQAALAAARLSGVELELYPSPVEGEKHGRGEIVSRRAAILPRKDRDLDARDALALVVEILGVGGRLGLEGAATARTGAFSRLGKGRRQASDGAAWSSAIEAAFYQVRSVESNDGWGPSPECLHIWVEEGVDAPVSNRLCVGFSADVVPPKTWTCVRVSQNLEVLVSRLLLTSLGVPGWEVPVGLCSHLTSQELNELLEVIKRDPSVVRNGNDW